MVKKHFKVLSIALACVLAFGTVTTAFAAEVPENGTTETNVVVDSEEPNDEDGIIITVPADGEAIVGFNGSAIAPCAQGEKVYFSIGETKYIQNCGFNPKFRFRASGGSSDTLIKFYITTSSGGNYTQGNIKADGTQYIDKQYIVLNGGGAWAFTASVVSGTVDTNILCSVEQIY